MAAPILIAFGGTKNPNLKSPTRCVGLKFRRLLLIKLVTRSDLLTFHFLKELIYSLVHGFS